jgi:hypothetical protein
MMMMMINNDDDEGGDDDSDDAEDEGGDDDSDDADDDDEGGDDDSDDADDDDEGSDDDSDDAADDDEGGDDDTVAELWLHALSINNVNVTVHTPITTSTDCRAFIASWDASRASANCFSNPSFSLSVDLCVVCAESNTPT